MIELYHTEYDCCGCTACESVCPNGAIMMQPNEEGFLYPLISTEKCISCGLCKQVCAFQNGYDISENMKEPLAFAVQHKDSNVRKTSTSGGAFTAISDVILSQNGVVYGASYDENMNVLHTRSLSAKERDFMKISKYVQSDLTDIFLQVQKDLHSGRTVLFTGTPCQCAGIHSFLQGTDCSRLLLCDIICRGVPSPVLWHSHIALSQKKEKSKIVDYQCRSKVNGWHSHTEQSTFADGTVDYSSTLSQKHKNLFHSHNALRPACYHCKYTNLNRPGDLTIADFWGIEQIMPEMDDNQGTSLVLINTPKGYKLFDAMKPQIVWEKSNLQWCMQPALRELCQEPLSRTQFWNDYRNHGYEYIARHYGGYGFYYEIRNRCRTFLEKMHLINFLRKLRNGHTKK